MTERAGIGTDGCVWATVLIGEKNYIVGSAENARIACIDVSYKFKLRATTPHRHLPTPVDVELYNEMCV